MKLNIPNTITICRIMASVVLFCMLGSYDHSEEYSSTLMKIAFVTFVLTALTDILDGYLARKLNQETPFGRIADPFVDKLLIIGSLIMLSAPCFTFDNGNILEGFSGNLPAWTYRNSITSLQPWMVVIIFSRELMVSAIRGYSESQGIAFPAIPVGKAKMLIQSFTTGTIIFSLGWAENIPWCNVVKIIAVWTMLVVTIYSGIIYIMKAKVFYASTDQADTNG